MIWLNYKMCKHKTYSKLSWTKKSKVEILRNRTQTCDKEDINLWFYFIISEWFLGHSSYDHLILWFSQYIYLVRFHVFKSKNISNKSTESDFDILLIQDSKKAARRKRVCPDYFWPWFRACFLSPVSFITLFLNINWPKEVKPHLYFSIDLMQKQSYFVSL